MPKYDTLGSTVWEARNEFKNSGLKFSEDMEAPPDDKILKQTPGAGEFVKKNSIVEIETEAHQLEKAAKEFGNNFRFTLLTLTKSDINGDPFNGIRNDIKYGDEGVYSGNYKDGIPDGNGTYETNEFRYSGDFSNGVPNGKGKWTALINHGGSNAGDYYDGDWIQGRPNGHGIIEWASGNKYVGGWLNGDRHGIGTYTWANGGKYVGGFLNGKRHGEGTRTWANGGKYVGGWLNGERHGEGTHTWANGDKYVGGWLNGKRHGLGVHTYGDESELAGDRIECNYLDDMPNGRGEYHYKDGRCDVGTWKDGKKQGTFLCYDADRQYLYEKRYIDGMLQVDTI